METPRDSAGLATGDRTILVIDRGNEFLDEEIFVALMAVKGVDVKTLAAFGHHHDELADLPLAHQTFPGLLAAMFAPALVMFEEAVQVIKHRVPVGAGIVAGRKRDAVIHRAPEDGAGNGFARDMSGGSLGQNWRGEKDADHYREAWADQPPEAQNSALSDHSFAAL